jgi:hypothetical protein
MSRIHPLVVLTLLPVWLAGCADDRPLEDAPWPGGPTTLALNQSPGARAGGVSAADIGGQWTVQRVAQLTAPEWVAVAIFGIEPEGPVTHFRCETVAGMSLTQNGREFTGTASWDAAENPAHHTTCETRGGQVFARPSPAITIHGHLNGRSLAFDWVEDGGFLTCPHRGVIVQAQDGTATQLRATGRCIVPGHPQSPVPLDPPPGGTSKVLQWEASR